MSFSELPKFKIKTKQLAKNFWSIEASLEYKSDKIALPPRVGQDPELQSLGLRLLSMIKEAEKEFRADGRRIVGDDNGCKGSTNESIGGSKSG